MFGTVYDAGFDIFRSITRLRSRLITCLNTKKTLVSKKGIIITGGILAAITVGSFMVWWVPEPGVNAMQLAQSLDIIHAEREAIQDTIESRYQEMLEGSLDPEDFVLEAQAATDQMTEIVGTLATVETYGAWEAVYGHYIEITQISNSIVQEMMVVANAIESGIEYQTSVDRIEELNVALQDKVTSCEPGTGIVIASIDICF